MPSSYPTPLPGPRQSPVPRHMPRTAPTPRRPKGYQAPVPNRPKGPPMRKPLPKPMVRRGYAGWRPYGPWLAPMFAFELGFIIVASQNIPAHWSDAVGVTNWGECGGHSHQGAGPFSLSNIPHIAAIGTGFSPNCTYTWPANQGVDARGHMNGYSGTRQGNFNVMWRNAGRLQLDTIVQVNPSTRPWPEIIPATSSPPRIMPNPAYRPLPWSPWQSPIGQPMPFPVPWSPPWAGGPNPRPPNEPNPGPNEPQPGPGTDSGNDPDPGPKPAPGAPPKPPEPPWPEPPKPREKERKVALRTTGGGINRIISGVTESVDNLNCAHGALPYKYQAKPVWVPGRLKPASGKGIDPKGEGGYNPSRYDAYNWRAIKDADGRHQRWQKQKGSYRPPTPQEKAEAVYKHAAQIDVASALGCIAQEFIEDAAWGRLGKLTADAARRSNRTGGYEIGPAL